jgi:hypothetical protein
MCEFQSLSVTSRTGIHNMRTATVELPVQHDIINDVARIRTNA